MVSCLILYHHTITSLTKSFMLRAMFHEEDFEIHVSGNNTVTIFLWNVNKEAVWQAALEFEMADIMTGYGFGKQKNDAEKEATKTLYRRISQNGESDDGFEVKEKPAAYQIGIAN
ncbi:hypothetical protein GCM10011409_38970 [Lentibacillus populi]|uniref:Uncharacterized protein n=1 Tax=Lentibacillus populi TaxID=1827502 RepID=A0A9W5X7M2_9BACI|nr:MULTISPECIES: hypothetical protein [Bacillaceae]MBT2217722.1 hypothetical protein [Virgibacillus dakarensis]GGB57688.1 hypothetical protein GCM10011409_38970 [Lentibacillus populi]